MFYLYFNESIKVPKFRFQIALNYIYFITLMLIGFMFGILNELLYRPSILTKSIRAVAASAETNWPGRDPTTKVDSMERKRFGQTRIGNQLYCFITR
jgi:hypothetical protein